MTDPLYILSRDEHNTLNLSMGTNPDTPVDPDQPIPEVVGVYTDIDTAAHDIVAELNRRMGWPF